MKQFCLLFLCAFILLQFGLYAKEGRIQYGNDTKTQQYNTTDYDPHRPTDPLQPNQKLKNPLSSGNYSFGVGLSYGFENMQGVNNKYGIIFSSQWVADRWLLELPLIVSYIAPNTRYFKAFHNNSGDGVNVDISVLSGWYFINKDDFKVALKGGIGYNLSYNFASSYRMSNAGDVVKDTSWALYNSLTLRIATEIAYMKHAFGIYFHYYIPTNESLSIMQAAYGSKGEFNPYKSESTQMLYNCIGMNFYYIYRF